MAHDIIGTSSSETIDGTTGDDDIYGRGGNDVLRGLAGDDWLFGESGNDTLIGGLGINDYWGGSGADIFAMDQRTTAGFSDEWRLVGALEALVGFILIGWSTAFMVRTLRKIID